MDDSTAKIISMVILLVDTLIFGWPPFFLVRAKGANSTRFNKIRKQIISHLTCFAGGVFLGACLLHLFPEGSEKIAEYFQKENITVEFPVYEGAVAGGFFLIAAIEQVAHKLLHKQAHKQRRNSVLPQTLQVPRSSEHERPAEVSQSSSDIEGGGVTITSLNGEASNSYRELGIIGDEYKQKRPTEECTHINDPDADNAETAPTNEMVLALQTTEGNLLRSLMLLTALSFHTIFDGLAVGLATGTSNVWQMFSAICIHKSLVALCLGTELFLAYSGKPMRAFITIAVFSLITPAGVGLGMLLSSENIDKSAQTLTNGLLQGMATGTFLYVTFFEILRVELAEKGGLFRLFLVAVGFGGMAAAKYLDAH